MKKTNFDQGWEFTELSGFAALFNPQAWKPVNLPHDAMIEKSRKADNPSGKGGGYFPGGVANYRKQFLVPIEWEGESIKIEFEGVYMNAIVSINGQQICRQPYGYSSFIADLTPHLLFGQENLLTVTANNTAQPNCRWYSGTGIYRHVWLWRGGKLRIKPWGGFVTTSVAEEDLSVVQVLIELEETCLTDAALLRSTINYAATDQSAAKKAYPLLKEALTIWHGKHAGRALKGLINVAMTVPALRIELRVIAEEYLRESRAVVRKAAKELLKVIESPPKTAG